MSYIFGMQSKEVEISKLQNNSGQIPGLPKNPRLIKDDKYKKLVKSIQDDPEMLALRELIVYPQNGHFVVIAGNMRLRAMQELKYNSAPCKVLPPETPVDKLKAYTIKDNIGYGEHEWDAIANEWDVDQLMEWGLDIPDFAIMPQGDELIGEDKNKPPIMKITFPEPEDLQECETEIQEVLNRKCPKAFYSVSAGEI